MRICLASVTNNEGGKNEAFLRDFTSLANSSMETCESLLHFHRAQIALEMAWLDLEAKRVGTAKKCSKWP